MGLKYAEEPFNMGMLVFFYLRRPSEWVYFQPPNTHIRAFLYWSRPPPPGGTTVRTGSLRVHIVSEVWGE